MTAAKVLEMMGCDEQLGDEAASADAQTDLTFRLRLSIKEANQDKRITELERSLEETRAMLNRVLVRFAAQGRPIPLVDVE